MTHNNVSSFYDLKFSSPDRGFPIMQAYAKFPNGYGASVIMGVGTIGGSQLLYELAVLKGDDLCYDTPITDDVIGYLTPEVVTDLLRQIAALEGANND